MIMWKEVGQINCESRDWWNLSGMFVFICVEKNKAQEKLNYCDFMRVFFK